MRGCVGAAKTNDSYVELGCFAMRRNGVIARALLAVAVGVLSPCAALAGYPAKAVEGSDALADLALMKHVLEIVHPGYDRFTPRGELDAAFELLQDEVRGGTTDAALFLGVSRLLERIRCDHTKAEYPPALRAWREEHPSFLPVRTHIFGDRLYAGTNRVVGLVKGAEILAINGIPASTLIAETEALISIDGNTDHARAAEAELSSEYMGSGLDTFMPLLHGWSESFTFVVRSDGDELTLTSEALRYGEFEAMVAGGERSASDFADAVGVDRLDAKTAVLTVGTFVNYRNPVDPDSVFGPIMRRLNEEGVEHLILDLRANGGGSDDAPASLFRHVISEPVTVRSGTLVNTVPMPEDIKQAVTTWDMSAFDAPRDMFTRDDVTGLWAMKGEGERTVEPAPDHFRGRVTALSSRANASGSTLFLSALQHHAGVRIVGEPTGGSVEGPTAGLIVFCALPSSGITVRVPVVRSVTGLTPDEPGVGITPDVLVTPTPEGFFAGRDEVLAVSIGG